MKNRRSRGQTEGQGGLLDGAAMADWGIDSDSFGGGVEPISTGWLSSLIYRIYSNSALRYFHPRPLVSFVLWCVVVMLLSLDHSNGYWLIAAFAVGWAFVRGLFSITENPRGTDDRFLGAVYSIFSGAIGILLFFNGLGWVGVFFVLDALISWKMTGITFSSSSSKSSAEAHMATALTDGTPVKTFTQATLYMD